MKMKFSNLLMLGMLVVVLAACGAPATPAPTAAPAATQAPAATTAPTAAPAKPIKIAVIMPSATTDMAFSQSMWSALQSIQKDMGGESAVQLAYSDNLLNVPDAAAAIRDYASKGFDIVIAHG